MHFNTTSAFVVLAVSHSACGDSTSMQTSFGDTVSAGTTTTTMSGTTAQNSTVPTTTMEPGSSTSSTISTTVGETTSTDNTTNPATSTGENSCPQGQIICEGDTAKACDGMGGFQSEVACENLCTPDLGCVLCVPGYQCVDGNSQLCAEGGQSWVDDETCDPIQGLSCNEQTGQCTGPCSKASLGNSYIGCEYYPTVTLNSVNIPTEDFAVAVANTTGNQAKITIERGGALITSTMIMADSTQTIVLPWVEELLDGNGPTVLIKDGAYRLRSDQPVTVYQFNQVGLNGGPDASLLLPVNAWTDSYLVAAWPPQTNQHPNFYTVVAQQDDTQVTPIPSQTGKLVRAGAGIQTDGTGVGKLNRGDVLQVVVNPNQGGDLTGTIVQANKPVQVIAGSWVALVPNELEGTNSSSHLEEAMFPLDTLAREYLVVPPIKTDDPSEATPQFVRFIASEDDTTLVFQPDQPVNKKLAKAGDFTELPMSTAKFLVTADKKILVAQYMTALYKPPFNADPSMVLAVNPQQWRQDYLVYAPPDWQYNIAILTIKGETEVTVDGLAVNGWEPIGLTDYSLAYISLSNEGVGNHRIVGNGPVGVSITGLDYVHGSSYWYPGGLDLNLIPQ